MQRLAWVFFAILLLAGCDGESTGPPDGPPDGPPVGMARLAWVDDARPSWTGDGPRPLRTTIWYPAPEGTEMTPVSFPRDQPVFVGGYAARDAEIAAADPYPLVLLSHGTGGSALQMMWLGRALAAQGFIAVAVDHHGNSAAEPAFDPRGFRMPWHRPRDLSAVLDRLLADETWGPRIDRTRIGAVGFSLGGYTVIALAGGRTDLDRFAAFCAGPSRDATCDPQPEYPTAEAEFTALLESDPTLAADVSAAGDDLTDPRIASVAVLAPALVQAFTGDSLAAIGVPVLAIAGGLDRVAPTATNAEPLVSQVPSGRLEVVPGADHLSFLNRCTSFGQRFVPPCQDAGSPREEVHAQAVDLLLGHLTARD